MSKSLKKLIDINRLREFKNKLVGTGSAYVQTGAVDQTVAGTKTFSNPIAGSVTGSSGSCTGNAATATRANSAASADTATNANYANSAGSVAWSNVTGKPTIPTNTNQLTNGAGFITSSGSCNYANSAGIAPSSDSVKGRGWLPNGVDMTTLTSGSYQCSPNNLPSQGVPYGTSPYGELLIACGSQYTSIIYIDVFGSSACWSSHQQAWVINVHSGNIGSQSVNYANSAGYADSAANANYANNAGPAGVIIPFAGTSVPTGYLLCNGAAVSRTDYANLFAAIGTLYGAGNGSTTFNLPDARDRVLQGASGWHSAGSYIAAGLPNITGQIFNGAGAFIYRTASGAFFVTGDQSQRRVPEDGAEFNYSTLFFNAQRFNALYGASNTVQSPAIATNFIIKY